MKTAMGMGMGIQTTSPLSNQIIQLFSHNINNKSTSTTTIITCGLRKPLRTKRNKATDEIISSEAIQAVQSLKLASRNPSKLDQVFNSKLNRLLKHDLLHAFAELQRQEHLDLALQADGPTPRFMNVVFKRLGFAMEKGLPAQLVARLPSLFMCQVFEFIRKEAWYEPDHSLYGDLMLMFGKKKLIDKVEKLFSELMEEGLKPDTRAYTELIGAYFKVDMIEKAMETYESMKASGCVPDELTFTIMIRNLESADKDELAAVVKNDCFKYMDSPKTFLKEVARKYPKRLRLNLV